MQSFSRELTVPDRLSHKHKFSCFPVPLKLHPFPTGLTTGPALRSAWHVTVQHKANHHTGGITQHYHCHIQRVDLPFLGLRAE